MLFMVSAILSLFVFVLFSIEVICSSSLGISCLPFSLLRSQLIFYQLLAICFLGVIYHLLKVQRKIYILINVSIIVFLLFISLILPDEILFGADTDSRRLILPHGDNILMVESGFTLWRALIDFTIIIFAVSTFLLLLKRLDNISFRTIVILFAGLGVILLAAIFDQLVDLGQIHSFYVLPFSLFVFYIILIFIPFIYFIKEIIDQQSIIQKQKEWHHLVNEAEIIVVGLNRMGHVEFINPYFFILTGYKEDEVIGKDWFEFFIPPKEYYNVQGAFLEILEYEFHPDYLNPILTRNKEEKMIRWFNVRTTNHLGKISGSLSIGIDMTSDLLEKESLLKKLKAAEILITKLGGKSEDFKL